MAGRDESVGASDPSDRVRRYRPADREAVVALHRRALADAGTDPADVPGTRDLYWVEEAYLATGGEFLVAEPPAAVDDDGDGDGDGDGDTDGGVDTDGDDDGIPDERRVVAMGGLLVDGDEGELYRFAVDPAYQRRGYGSAILDAIERAARERGVDRLALTTASRQEAAVAFYRSRGFTEVDRESHGEYELLRFARSLDGS